jgi:RNA recognition motif-containing protein
VDGNICDLMQVICWVMYVLLLHCSWDDFDTRSVEVKLLTQGRMKGQCFVTLPSEDMASQALDMINGLQWNDKVIAVVSLGLHFYFLENLLGEQYVDSPL